MMTYALLQQLCAKMFDNKHPKQTGNTVWIACHLQWDILMIGQVCKSHKHDTYVILANLQENALTCNTPQLKKNLLVHLLQKHLQFKPPILHLTSFHDEWCMWSHQHGHCSSSPCGSSCSCGINCYVTSNHHCIPTC